MDAADRNRHGRSGSRHDGALPAASTTREFKLSLTKDAFPRQARFRSDGSGAHSKAREYFQTASFFADIPVMAGSQEVVRELMSAMRCSSRPLPWMCRAHSRPNSNGCRDTSRLSRPATLFSAATKALCAADYLIDDDPRHLPFRGRRHSLHRSSQRA